MYMYFYSTAGGFEPIRGLESCAFFSHTGQGPFNILSYLAGQRVDRPRPLLNTGLSSKAQREQSHRINLLLNGLEFGMAKTATLG